MIAIIAILHVVISHLAVGGGLFLVLTEGKALRTKNPALLEYVRKHTWFFLLLTMVFGGMSGVGIWFIIALVNPAATSSLIHTFVFGWAIEWHATEIIQRSFRQLRAFSFHGCYFVFGGEVFHVISRPNAAAGHAFIAGNRKCKGERNLRPARPYRSPDENTLPTGR